MNSDSNKSHKVAINFLCEICNYKCSKQSDFNKHINTAKHINRINGIKKSQKSPKINVCVCGKEYKYSRGLWEHKRKCSHNNNNAITVIENIEEKPSMMDIITQNKEIMDALVLQNEQLHRLKRKMRQNELNINCLTLYNENKVK